MAARVLKGLDFNQTLFQGMLSFLLFAGALHINLNDLAEQRWVITILAVIGVLISTLVFGTTIYLVYLVFAWLNLKLSYAWALLFGTLISPTDPITVSAFSRPQTCRKAWKFKLPWNRSLQ